MKVALLMDGRTEAKGSALLMHNERLADPLDDFVQTIAGTSRKRNKTVEDHEFVARYEFGGGAYTNPPLTVVGFDSVNGAVYEPVIPAWNVIRCLQDGATRQKRGKDVLRGVFPIGEHATLRYDGPRDIRELWTDGGYSLRKSVGIQKSRTMRTRPFFVDWHAELAVEIDPTIFDLHTLRVAWADAGTYYGIGDMRPVYGRFVGTIEEIKGGFVGTVRETKDDKKGDKR